MGTDLHLTPKLKDQGTTIFTVMSKLALDHDAINLGQGFPDFDADNYLLELVAKYVRDGKNQYCPLAGLPRLLEVLSAKMERSYGVQIDPEKEICITAGATQALFTAITAVINSGDEVIIIEPAYDCYRPQVELAGGKVVVYSLSYPEYKINWEEFGTLVNDKTRMIIINTPHNPTGTLLKEQDLRSLEQLVVGKNIVVLSDEVYEHIIFDQEPHQSVLRFPVLFQQSMAVFSFGKTLHATGWKLGYIVGPDRLISLFKSVHQWNVFCVNSFLQYAIADYLEEASHYHNIPMFFQEKRDYMKSLFEQLPLKPLLSKGTYFQLYSFDGISEQTDVELARDLTTKLGVATIPLSPFYSNPPNDPVLRFCFAKRSETIERAAERLEALNDG